MSDMRHTDDEGGRRSEGATRRGRAWILVLSAAIVGVLAQAQGPQAPAPPAPPVAAPPAGTPDAPPPRPGRYLGVATCASALCHGSTRPQQDSAVLQNEYHTWQKEDRHAHAYETLLAERSRTIARNLGLGRAAHEDRRCLDCHALAPPRERVAGRLEVEDGIACESCHGPASGWLESHRGAGVDRADLLAAGLVELRDPAVRAGVCLGCHLGAPGREVDHELIAAGHPALVFELDNFAGAMPPHWAPGAQRAGRGAPAWAAGQVAALRAGLSQLARRAGGGPWPELAELACDDCHHSLAEERWRRPRPERTGAGRPAWSPARWWALAPLAATVAPEAAAGLAAEVAALAREASRLGGSGDAVAARAAETEAALAALERRLAQANWDAARSRAILAGLAAAGPPPDYDSAAQALLAAHSLAADLIAREPALARSGLVETLDALDRALAERAGYDRDRVAELLAQLADTVRRSPR